MKKLVIFLTLLYSAANTSQANAQFFGPDSYEECILESMEGVSSDIAAREIVRACRSQFPREYTPPIPISNPDCLFLFNSDTFEFGALAQRPSEEEMKNLESTIGPARTGKYQIAEDLARQIVAADKANDNELIEALRPLYLNVRYTIYYPKSIPLEGIQAFISPANLPAC